jgi:adenosylcobinamide-GDP ribazoletransferase
MRDAIQFLTILPVPLASAHRPLGRSVWAFPIVGALAGAAAATICVFLANPAGPLLGLIMLALLTGGLHEDGLADVFDAVRAGRSRDRMLAILKDSRIGAHGALALILSIIWRWQALSSIPAARLPLIAAALAISRGAMVVLAASSRSAGEGLGAEFVRSITRTSALLVWRQRIGAAAVCGWPTAAWMTGANVVLLVVLRAWFAARLGGVTGDCLGAACQLSECVSLGVLAWA